MPLLLLIIGFVSAALVAVLDVTEVNWALFVLPLLVGLAGVFWHRHKLHAAASHDSHVHGNLATLERSLGNISGNLEALLKHPHQLPVHEARFAIDRQFRNDLCAFAEAREAMRHAFGIQHYADIMSSFAAGERYLNRVWSASADGYVDEVNAYLHKAQTQFSNALQLLLVQQKLHQAVVRDTGMHQPAQA